MKEKIGVVRPIKIFLSVMIFIAFFISTSILYQSAWAQDNICDTCLDDPSACPPECMGGSSDTQNPAVCGNGVCEENEKVSCPEDCQSQQECVEYWVCTPWSECIGGKQTRYCVDNNKCGTEENKPPETKSCTEKSTSSSITQPSSEVPDGSQAENEEVITPTEGTMREYTNEAQQTPEKNKEEKIDNSQVSSNRYLILAVGLAATFLLLVATILLLGRKRNIGKKERTAGRYSSENLASLDEWIRNALKRGYSFEEVEKALISSGWDEDLVKERIAKVRKEID